MSEKVVEGAVDPEHENPDSGVECHSCDGVTSLDEESECTKKIDVTSSGVAGDLCTKVGTSECGSSSKSCPVSD